MFRLFIIVRDLLLKFSTIFSVKTILPEMETLRLERPDANETEEDLIRMQNEVS